MVHLRRKLRWVRVGDSFVCSCNQPVLHAFAHLSPGGFGFANKLGLRCIYFEFGWGNNRLLPDWSPGAVNGYKKTDASFCASSQRTYFCACRGNRVCFRAYNHDGYPADFHRVRLRHVLHHDDFPLNGGYSSGKSRALRRNGRLRLSDWRLPWTISCLPPQLRSNVHHHSRRFLSRLLRFETVPIKSSCTPFLWLFLVKNIRNPHSRS